MKHIIPILFLIFPLASFSQTLVRDVFDFAVGDTFQLRTNNPGGEKYISQIVTNRQNYYPDSIVYTFHNIIYSNGPNTIETSTTTARITKIDTPIFVHQLYICNSCTNNTQYTESRIGVTNYVTEYSYSSYYPNPPCQDNTIHENGELWMGVGLGITFQKSHYSNACMNGGQRNEMIFYRKASGATYGTPHSSLYTSISNVPSNLPTVSLSPNPGSGYFTLELSQQPNRNTTLQLYSLTGQLLSTHLLQNEATNIDVSTLPKGIYMWQLEADGKTIQNGKLIMQ
ncbi:MAG: T9SS type A sorting domain-containing protein [Bacteroidetes bacterium]|nr:T9SS type A sorting domain-containing protein [Bacteroidota bacterium]